MSQKRLSLLVPGPLFLHPQLKRAGFVQEGNRFWLPDNAIASYITPLLEAVGAIVPVARNYESFRSGVSAKLLSIAELLGRSHLMNKTQFVELQQQYEELVHQGIISRHLLHPSDSSRIEKLFREMTQVEAVARYYAEVDEEKARLAQILVSDMDREKRHQLIQREQMQAYIEEATVLSEARTIVSEVEPVLREGLELIPSENVDDAYLSSLLEQLALAECALTWTIDFIQTRIGDVTRFTRLGVLKDELVHLEWRLQFVHCRIAERFAPTPKRLGFSFGHLPLSVY